MAAIVRFALIVLVAVNPIPGIARADDTPADPRAASLTARSYPRFAYDTRVEDGFRAEIRVTHTEFETRFREPVSESRIDVAFDSIDALQHFVWGNGEVELDLSFTYAETDTRFSGERIPTIKLNEGGISNLHFDAKTQLLDASLSDDVQVRVAGGIGMAFPTTSNDDLFDDEFHFDAFAAVALDWGPVSWETHAGYTETDGPDDVFYGSGLFVSLFDRLVIRSEFTGVYIDKGKILSEDDQFMLDSGFDVRLLYLGSTALILRGNGGVGLNRDAPDWSAGGGVALDF